MTFSLLVPDRIAKTAQPGLPPCSYAQEQIYRKREGA
jgi:hypothetical protein